MAEATDLKSVQCGFESHREHVKKIMAHRVIELLMMLILSVLVTVLCLFAALGSCFLLAFYFYGSIRLI